MVDKKEVERKLVIVKELPAIVQRDIEQDGVEYTCMTNEEALAEILATVRELKLVLK